MKKLSLFIFLNVVLLLTIFAVYSVVLNNYTKYLEMSDTQFDGVTYLQKISKLSMKITKYMGGVSYDVKKKDLQLIYKDINFCVDEMYKQQLSNKFFINKKLNLQLNKIKLFEMSEDEYYQF